VARDLHRRIPFRRDREPATLRLAKLESGIRANDPALTRRDCHLALTGGLLWDACAESVESGRDRLRTWSADPAAGCWAVGFIDETTDDDPQDDELCAAAAGAADLVRMANLVATDASEASALTRIVDRWRAAHLLPRGQATGRLVPGKAAPGVRQIAELVDLLPGGPARAMVCLQAHLLTARRRRGRRRKAIRVLFEQRGEGVSGTLEVEILPGGPPGLFPDPRTMSMVTADPAFEDAITDAWKYVTGRRESRECVLWRLSIDGPWNLRIQHGSLGAAFAVLLSEVIGPPGGRLASGPIGAVRAAGRWLRVRRDRMAVTGRAMANGDLAVVGGLKAKFERAKTLRLSVVAPRANERADAQFADGVRVRWVPDVRTARHELYRIDRVRTTVVAAGLVVVVAASGFGLYVTQIKDRRHAQAVAASRQIVAEAKEVAGAQPGLARQLLVEAYRIQPTDEALGGLLNGSSIPGVLHIPGLEGVAFAPNRAMLAVATDTGVRLLNPATGGLIATMSRGNGMVGTLAFAPDGRTLAAAGRDGVWLWDVTDPVHPRVLNELNSDDGLAEEMTFTPDGHTLIVSSGGQRVRLWNVADPLLASPVATIPGDGLSDAPLTISPDGRTIATGGPDFAVRLWDIADRAHPRLLATPHGHTNDVSAVRFSPDGHILASGGLDDTVRLWDVTSRTHPKELSTQSGHTYSVSALAFSPDGHTLASAAGDDEARLWNVADPLRPSAITTLAGQVAINPELAFSGDGRVVASTGDGDILRLWNVANPGASVPRVTVAGAGSSVAYRPDGEVLLTPGRDYTARLWDVRDLDAPKALGVLTGHTYLLSRAVFSPDGRTVATSSLDDTTRLWDVRDPAHPKTLATLGGQAETVGDAAFSPDGRLLVTSVTDKGLRLWDVTDPARPRARGSISAAGAARFRPAGHLLLTTGDNKHPAQLWDVGNPDRPRPYATLRKSAASTATFSPDGRTLLTAESADTATLWSLADPAHPKVRATLTGTGTVYAAAFSADRRLLATAGSQSQVQIWNVTDLARPTSVIGLTGRPALFGAQDALAFGPDGRSLATGGNAVALWDVSPAELMRRLCTESGDPITPTQWRQYVPRYDYERPCGSAAAAGPVPPVTAPAGTPAPAPPRPSPATTAKPLDLRRYDWANAELPVPFCSVTGTVRFRNMDATAPSTEWGQVHLRQFGKVSYGDLLGNGHPVAAVPLQCDNGGGTADSELAAADAIFDGSSGRLTLLGAVTPQQPSAQITTNIDKVRISRGRITVYEIWYRPPDNSCCATGRAVTDWTYVNGRFVPAAPHITN
jgi:WD40 repeat protein